MSLCVPSPPVLHGTNSLKQLNCQSIRYCQRTLSSQNTPHCQRILKSQKIQQAMDPELARQRKNEYNRTRMAFKYATDPIWREKHLADCCARGAARLASDPEYRAREAERLAQLHRSRVKKNPVFAVRCVLRKSLYQSSIGPHLLTWKTHVPVKTTEKVERHCASCHIKRRGGVRLWWQRRQVPEHEEPLYDCTTCSNKNPTMALPEGFEDVKTVQQLYLRREQLLDIKPRRRKNSSVSCPPSST
jgi:hypothetical protein